MLHRLYDRMMALAAGPRAVAALIVVAFVESSFFPIPPDILLIPMVLAAPRKAWRYAVIATLASVAGGFLGYAIGYFLFATLGRPILEFYGAMARYAALQAAYDHWGVWIIVLKGMTPIPYKIVTIASGALPSPWRCSPPPRWCPAPCGSSWWRPCSISSASRCESSSSGASPW